MLFRASKGDVESDRRDDRCKRKGTYRDTAYKPLYVPSTPYCNAFHEAKNEKDFQPLTARGQGSATSKPPMGSRNIATYFACTMSVVRLRAYQ